MLIYRCPRKWDGEIPVYSMDKLYEDLFDLGLKDIKFSRKMKNGDLLVDLEHDSILIKEGIDWDEKEYIYNTLIGFYYFWELYDDKGVLLPETNKQFVISYNQISRHEDILREIMFDLLNYDLLCDVFIKHKIMNYLENPEKISDLFNVPSRIIKYVFEHFGVYYEGLRCSN